jgi:hypothetical protein
MPTIEHFYTVYCKHFILKGIFQPFELGSETRLIGSAVINWRPGKFKIFVKIILNMVLCSSRETVSLKKNLLAGLPVFYSGSNLV